MLTFAEFFAGVGGFRLGLERAGMRCVWSCEIAEFPRRVYAARFGAGPDAKDLREVDPASIPEADLWVGGFPCQPFSNAGKMLGEHDSRNLWPEWWRCIRLRMPRILFLENVPGLLTSGYFERILYQLSSIGYAIEWDCIPASSIGAHHRRDRLWIIAALSNADAIGRRRRPDHEGAASAERKRDPEAGANTYAHGGRCEGEQSSRRDKPNGFRKGGRRAGPEVAYEDPEEVQARRRRRRSIESGMGGMPYGVSSWMDGSWEEGIARVCGRIPHRADRLRALGNAVVPPLIEWIGWRLRAAFDLEEKPMPLDECSICKVDEESEAIHTCMDCDRLFCENCMPAHEALEDCDDAPQ